MQYTMVAMLSKYLLSFFNHSRNIFWLLCRIILFLFLLIVCSCSRCYEKIEPQIYCSVQDYYLTQLPAPFPDLTEEEKNQPWGIEYWIGQSFARELDFYRAITGLKRADFLIPKDHWQRRLEIQHQILLSYYLGRRYEEVDATFSKTMLSQVDPNFPTYCDLLIILYDSYEQCKQCERAGRILSHIGQINPVIQEGLILSSALQKGDLCTLQTWDSSSCFAPGISELLVQYNSCKKSPGIARGLNALLPGSGYLYLGQKQTAFTAFLVNGLFIAAAVQFFRHGHTAAGIIAASFEAGWYLGGIVGAGHEAKFYNERLYEQRATPFMNQNGLFPLFMLHYGF